MSDEQEERGIDRADFIAWRKRLGLTRQGMADYMGVSLYAVIKYENGQRGITGAAAQLVRLLWQLEAIAPEIAAHWRGETAPLKPLKDEAE